MKRFLININNAIKAMGLVFGDIGTSPIYTLSVIFLTLEVTKENIISMVSLIIWALILIVCVQYATFAMSLSRRGEGGAIVLSEIVKKLVHSSRATVFFSYLAYLGISLLIGDSVITPAISILSAVEGLEFVPHFEHIAPGAIIFITVLIAIGIFSVQKKGIEKVTQVFGPIMFVWFVVLGVSGVVACMHSPQIIAAVNPLYGLRFLATHSLAGFFLLSEVVLCVTGAEALYADMGHLGRKPIINAWYFVFIALVLNYLGQGAYLMNHPGAKVVIFEMFSSVAPMLYIALLLVSILATIIASQAMISSTFSIIYQAINVRIFPLLKVNFTSPKLKSQIYIDSVNWLLMVCVICTILIFKKSSALAGAYGFAASGAIMITGAMVTTIFVLKRKYWIAAAAFGIFVADLCFFGSCFSKLQHGAWWSIGLACVPLFFITLWINGSRVLYSKMFPMDKEHFLEKYNSIIKKVNLIKGTALFFAKGIYRVAPYIVNTMFTNNIIYTDNVFVSINQLNEPRGVSWEIEPVTQGLRILKIDAGYMEILDLQKIFKQAKIEERAIFYGVEDIESRSLLWTIFAKVKKLIPTFMQFYKLPPHKVHGVMTHVEMN